MTTAMGSAVERPDSNQAQKEGDTLKAMQITRIADGELAKKTILPLQIR